MSFDIKGMLSPQDSDEATGHLSTLEDHKATILDDLEQLQSKRDDVLLAGDDKAIAKHYAAESTMQQELDKIDAATRAVKNAHSTLSEKEAAQRGIQAHKQAQAAQKRGLKGLDEYNVYAGKIKDIIEDLAEDHKTIDRCNTICSDAPGNYEHVLLPHQTFHRPEQVTQAKTEKQKKFGTTIGGIGQPGTEFEADVIVEPKHVTPAVQAPDLTASYAGINLPDGTDRSKYFVRGRR